MHKILILGHPSSNYQDVAELLHAYGMNKAKPSRRDGFSPVEISEIICQAHGISENSGTNVEPNFNQLDVGNIWHGMALDLMLGNLDSKIWGWADAKSIYLLNYWRDLDPEITFVLVYSNPEDVLLHNEQAENISADGLEGNIQHWIAYNETLLHFYNRNKDRCFLVHSQQVGESSNRYLLEIGAKVNAPWLNKISDNQLEISSYIEEADVEETDYIEFIESKSQSALSHEVEQAVQSNTVMDVSTELAHEIAPYKLDAKEKSLPSFLSRLIIQQHPKLIQMYEDLQSFANFPLKTGAAGYQQQNFNQSAFNAWLEMTSYLNQLKQSEEAAQTVAQKNAELISELIKLEEIPKLEQENAQVLTQLHQVQEQLEQFYLDNKTLKENEVGYESKLKELNEAQIQLQTLQPELKKLETLPELEQENSMLLSQLHHVQEELERYYLENQTYKQAATNPSLHNANSLVHEYTAEQIKRQLPYRLGGEMIKRSKTVFGLFFMPLALLRVTRACKAEQLQLHDNNQQTKKHKLTEYEVNQIAIVKKHLSYRFGVVLLDSIRNPFKWLTLPYKLWRELKLYKQ